MDQPIVKEVNTPYILNPDDETLGRETVIVRRNGEPIAAILPYAEYQNLVRDRPDAPAGVAGDPEFERNRAAFFRLLPELLAQHRGEWVAIVNEEPVLFGPDSASVLDQAYDRLGRVRLYVQEIVDSPRVYHIEGPRLRRRAEGKGGGDEA